MKKRVCILMGSPRKNGNTMQLLQPFMQQLQQSGCECELIWLYDKNIQPCRACRCCQKDHSIFGCAIRDDMPDIFDSVLQCDLLVLATPIYSWYCTPPMKSVLDRLVYGMNKYYGETKGPAIWAGKMLAAVTTCGYPPEKGSDIFAEGLERYCRHSCLEFAGMITEHHKGYNTVFMDSQKAEHIKEFVQKLYK